MADASAFRTDYFTQPSPNSLFDTANSVVNFANAAQQNKLLGQEYAVKQRDVLNGALAAIAANPNASRADFERMGTLVQQGLFTPEFYQAEMANIPAQGTPDQYRSIANGYLARLMSPGELYAVQTGYGPGGAAGLQTYTGAGGEAKTNTTGNIASQFGVGAGAPGLGGGNAFLAPAPNSGPASTPAPLGGNMLVPNGFGLESDQQPFGMAAPSDVAQAGGGGVSGPTPMQAATWQQSTDQYNADRTTAAQWQQRVTPLEKLNDLLETNVVTGKGSDVVSDLSKVAATFGIPVSGASDQASIVSQIEKYAAQIARSSGAAPNSADQLAASISSTPNASMDKLAARDVTKVLLGLERFQQGKFLAAQAMGVTPQQYADFAVQWGATQDPRAFAFDLMTPEARKTLVDGMSDDEFARFQQSVQDAQNLGLIRGSGGGGGQ